MRITNDKKISPQFFELKPDGSLLDPKFSGYKLSLNSVPIQTHQLKTAVDKVGPAEDQFSLQHVTLFATHNLIFPDPWTANTVYYVDVDWNVWMATNNTFNGRLSDPVKVWNIPIHGSKIVPGRFNVSITFPSSNYALITDGCGLLYLVERCNHENNIVWTELFSTPSLDQLKSSVILDGISYSDQQGDFVDVLTLRVEEKSTWMEQLKLQHNRHLLNGDNVFFNILEWQTLMKDPDNSWGVKSRRLLAGSGGIHYACIEPLGSAIYIAGDTPYYFVDDSETPMVIDAEPQEHESKMEDAEEKPDYLWSQTDEEVTVWFSLPGHAQKDEIEVVVDNKSLMISYKKQEMLNGAFLHDVTATETIWTIESGKLEVTLQKVQSGLMWAELVPGNISGQQIIDQEMLEEIHTRLSHLCSDKWEKVVNPVLAEAFDEQLEDCDRFADENASFMRIAKSDQSITHQTSLSSHPVLFVTRTTGNKVPSICLRSYLDGTIWQPEKTSSTQGCGSTEDTNSWQFKHVGTISAFGYVQASKTQRKFTVCPPDFSYVAICDAVKHIYLYRQPEAIENELRNRKTGDRISHVASQQVISIEPPVEILGAHATEEFLFILNSNHLHSLRIKQATEV